MEQICSGAYKIDDNLLDIDPEPLILTDVNDYCKIKVFEHLISSDLLSVKSSYFAEYTEDGSKRHVKINRSTALKVLRNFGHLLSDIAILFGTWNGDNSYDLKFLFDLGRYLIEYCSKSVEKITLYGIQPECTTAFRTIGIQLPNITTVHIVNSYLGKKFSFNANFPNLQSLSLYHHTCNFNVKDWHFPTVKHLHFNYWDYYSFKMANRHNYKLKEIDLIEMLKRNPQLEKLELYLLRSEFVLNVAKCLIECLPNLHSLSLILNSEVKPLFLSFEPVHLGRITDFTLYVRGSQQYHEDINIPFTFNRLEHFRFEHCADKRAKSTAVTNFVSQNKYLKTIEVCDIDDSTVIQLFQLENVISNVEELCICARDNVPADAVDMFLNQSRSLKLLKICNIDGMSDTIKSKISERKMHMRCNGTMSSELFIGKTEGITSASTFFYTSVFIPKYF